MKEYAAEIFQNHLPEQSALLSMEFKFVATHRTLATVCASIYSIIRTKVVKIAMFTEFNPICNFNA